MLVRCISFFGTQAITKKFAHETSQRGTRFEDGCGLDWRGSELALIITRSSILAVEASHVTNRVPTGSLRVCRRCYC
jgi:hypothetical protein